MKLLNRPSIMALLLSALMSTGIFGQNRWNEAKMYEEFFETLPDGETKHGAYKKIGRHNSNEGTLLEQGNYQMGKRNGKWLVRRGIGEYSKNLRIGIWHFKSVSGQVEQIYDYSKSLMIKDNSKNIFSVCKLSSNESIVPDTEPVFIGGSTDWYLQVAQHLNYPKIAAQQRKAGEVLLQLSIGETGAIESIAGYQNANDGFDQATIEAIKAVEAMFTPAIYRGNAVSATCVVKLAFLIK